MTIDRDQTSGAIPQNDQTGRASPNAASAAHGTDPSVGELKDKTAAVASSAADTTKQVAAEASDQVREVIGHTKEQFHGLVDQTKHELGTQLDQRGRQAASGLQTVAQQLTALTDGRPQEAGPLIGYVHEAQSRVQGLAQKLDQGGPQAVFTDIASFARRRPVTFLAGAAIVGFAVGRTVRAGAAASHEGLTQTGLSSIDLNETLGARPEKLSPPSYSAVPVGGPSDPLRATP